MATTSVNLYRSVRVEQFPDGVLEGLDPAEGLLDPDFYPKDVGGGNIRAADVEMETIENVEWVKPGGGTSLFDRPAVFTKPGWLSFEIPGATPIPESLVVVDTGYNKRFKANHHQIEPRTLMTKAALGALDNFARSAIARSVELGRLRQLAKKFWTRRCLRSMGRR